MSTDHCGGTVCLLTTVLGQCKVTTVVGKSVFCKTICWLLKHFSGGGNREKEFSSFSLVSRTPNHSQPRFVLKGQCHEIDDPLILLYKFFSGTMDKRLKLF